MFEFLFSGFQELLAFVDRTDPQYIYLLLFLIAFTENIIPPIPGDTFTIIGGYLAAIGKLSLAPTFLFILAGTMSSIMVVYAIGYRVGRGRLAQSNSRLFSRGDMARVQGWFDRFGAGILLASRFVVGARVAIAAGAGVSRYPTLPMAFYSLISSALFHGALIALAYGMRAYIDRLQVGFDIYSKIILVIVTVVVIIWITFIVRRFMHDRKKI